MIDNVHNENDLFDLLASRFCMAELPKTVCSDTCVSNPDYKFPRSGTNLLTVMEAEEVLRQVITPDMINAMLAPDEPASDLQESPMVPITNLFFAKDVVPEEKIVTTDISSEEYRLYTYTNGSYFKINAPLELSVKENGSHRVVDAEGLTHRPTPGWLAITWKAKAGKPPFVV